MKGDLGYKKESHGLETDTARGFERKKKKKKLRDDLTRREISMGRQIEGQSSGRWKSSGLLLMFLGRIKVQEEVSSHTRMHTVSPV